MSDKNNSDQVERGNAPVDTERDGPIRSAIFQNDGDKGPFFTATLEKHWRDDKGAWHSSTNFNESEVLRASEVMRKVHHKILRLRRDHSQTREADAKSPAKEERREKFQGQRRSSPRKKSRSRQR